MSEFREDPVSGDWIILSPERAKRPEELVQAQGAPRCFAEKQGARLKIWSGQGTGRRLRYILRAPATWRMAVIPNKYPALTHLGGCAMDILHGVYHAKTGIGDHEIVIARDHRKNIAELSLRRAPWNSSPSFKNAIGRWQEIAAARILRRSSIGDGRRALRFRIPIIRCLPFPSFLRMPAVPCTAPSGISRHTAVACAATSSRASGEKKTSDRGREQVRDRDRALRVKAPV